MVLLASAPATAAPEALTRLRMPDDRMELSVQPEELPPAERLEKAAPRPRFGEPESTWLTIGAGIGHDFDDATDANIHAAYSYFLIEDVELAAELGLWYFGEGAEFAVGVSPNIVFRWHFVNTEDWTVFADAGIGLVFSTDDVPDDGTSFNFAPRAGVGFTRRLNDSGMRFQAGLRWHHMSNARITGNTDNPGRDAPFVYAGIVMPF